MNIKPSLKIMNVFPIAMLITDQKGAIEFANKQMLSIMGITGLRTLEEELTEIEKLLIGNNIRLDSKNITECQLKNKSFLLQTVYYKDHQYHFFYGENDLEKLLKKTDLYRELDQDLKAIFENTYDVIYVSDGKGKTLRVSSASERLWGYKKEDLIGKTAFELEEMKVYKPSITLMVLEQKKQVKALQTTGTGRRLLVVGTPIKDESGKITRVINTSRDVTDANKLKSELDETKSILKDYQKELKSLKLHFQKERSGIVYRSPAMGNVISLAKKVADTQSTILIYGESGVGKERLARYIHEQSNKFLEPFITLNCAGMPGKLLEKELFGYGEIDEVGGLFKKSSKGTLLLEEVDEIPINIQSKLLHFLSKLTNKEDASTNNNLRIIAATERDLKKLVKEGSFRKDLYYFLNVIPIYIPPLSERRDDILPLIMVSINYFNKIYSTNKKLSQDACDNLITYSWPDNVRELRNLIERLIVTSQADVISKDELPHYILENGNSEEDIFISNLMPLNTAVELTEKKLLKMAMTKYQTTTQIAQVLKVNQSTVSRKIKKYFY